MNRGRAAKRTSEERVSSTTIESVGYMPLRIFPSESCPIKSCPITSDLCWPHVGRGRTKMTNRPSPSPRFSPKSLRTPLPYRFRHYFWEVVYPPRLMIGHCRVGPTILYGEIDPGFYAFTLYSNCIATARAATTSFTCQLVTTALLPPYCIENQDLGPMKLICTEAADVE